jgi:hypothetical protein
MARVSHEAKVRLSVEDRASPALKSARASIDDTKQSLESFDKATKVAGKSADDFSGRLKTGMVAAAAAAAGAVYGLATAFKAGFNSMVEAEKANRSLTIALKKTDDATKSNLAALTAQADAIHSTTRFTADSITQTQAFLKQLGVQTSQLKQATQATIDMSESLGMNLESAARNVGKTVGGFAGELGEVIPELKTLSAEALRSGEGIELLARKFAGAAKEAGQEGLEGALAQLNNELSDAKKNFAIGVTGATDFEEAIRGATTEVRDSQSAIEDVGRVFGFAFAKPLGVAKDALEAIGTIIAAKTNPALVAVTKRTQEAADKQRLYAATLTDVEAAEKKRLDTINALDLGYASLGDRLDRLRALRERDNRINGETAELVKEVTAAFSDLGITLESEVNAQIENNERKLEKIRLAYDRRLTQNGELVVSAKDLADAENQVAINNDALAKSIEWANDALDGSASSFNRAKQAVDADTESLKENTEATRLNTEEKRRGAGSDFSNLSGGTFTFFTEISTGRRYTVNPDGTRNYYQTGGVTRSSYRGAWGR